MADRSNPLGASIAADKAPCHLHPCTVTPATTPLDRERILALARQHGIYNVRVFGSVARTSASPGSDLDLLVDVAPERSYLDLIAFWQSVEDFLGRHVDVVTEGGISPYLRDSILTEAVAL